MERFFINIQNICGDKSETIWCMWSKFSMGGKHHSYYKHTESESWPKIPCWFECAKTSIISIMHTVL